MKNPLSEQNLEHFVHSVWIERWSECKFADSQAVTGSLSESWGLERKTVWGVPFVAQFSFLTKEELLGYSILIIISVLLFSGKDCCNLNDISV